MTARPFHNSAGQAGRSRLRSSVRPCAAFIASALLCSPLLCGCGKDPNMKHQPKMTPLAATSFFANGASARPRVVGTVTREPTPWEADEPGAAPLRRPEVTMKLLRRGQERFDIFCSVCHGRDGYGQGMVVRRGFPPPPSLHDQTIRSLPDDHYYKVITLGLGKMPPYRDQVPPADRYAIIAYVRALQLSQHAAPADLPASSAQTAAPQQHGRPAVAANTGGTR